MGIRSFLAYIYNLPIEQQRQIAKDEYNEAKDIDIKIMQLCKIETIKGNSCKKVRNDGMICTRKRYHKGMHHAHSSMSGYCCGCWKS